MSALDSIVSCAIHPAIGIARVGNSQEQYFIGPEVPGLRPSPDMRFKDADGRVKRQAARFRIYGLDAQGNVVQELTAEHAQIQWRVHLANRKAGWYQFLNAMDLPGMGLKAPLRNAKETSGRENLVIDPGPRAITGISQRGTAYHFDTGRFQRTPVYLGELRTDEEGRLLVLGGRGHSASSSGAQPTTFANNDGWHDDISDGPVRATVRIGERVLEARPAMVAVTPPNFGPGLQGVVTMYDVVYDLFLRQKWLRAASDKPSFWRDIFPIFERLVTAGDVNAGFFMLFGAGSPSHFLSPALLAQLADPSEAARPVRQRVFEWFRDPESQVKRDAALPPFYGDAFSEFPQAPAVSLSLTRTQYGWLRAWAQGDFTAAPEERTPPPRELESLPIAEQPHALDRAPLEDCLGGPFHPGIELTWTLRHPGMWEAPFRLKLLPEGAAVRMDYGPELTPEVALSAEGPLAASGPGTLTCFMGVPWQTDEASCMSGYEPGTYLPLPSFWAARVPNHVLPERAYQRLQDTSLPLPQRYKHLHNRPEWLRFMTDQYLRRINNMVNQWDKVGIIAERPGPADSDASGMPTRLWVETEVWAGWLAADATYAQTLIAEGAQAPEPHRSVVRALETLKAVPTPEQAPGVTREQTHSRPLLGRDEL